MGLFSSSTERRPPRVDAELLREIAALERRSKMVSAAIIAVAALAGIVAVADWLLS